MVTATEMLGSPEAFSHESKLIVETSSFSQDNSFLNNHVIHVKTVTWEVTKA